jgi:hypothetical protein
MRQYINSCHHTEDNLFKGYLHDTLIVSETLDSWIFSYKSKNGTYWNTHTTRKRMNEYAQDQNLDLKIYQRSFNLYVKDLRNDKVYKFIDGLCCIKKAWR